MRVLTGSRHPDSPWPVEVHVGEFVTKREEGINNKEPSQNNILPDPLDGVHGEPQAVTEDDVVGGRDGALAHVLGDEEEVVVVPPGDGVVQHRPGGRIVQLLPHPERNNGNKRTEQTRQYAYLWNILVLILFWTTMKPKPGLKSLVMCWKLSTNCLAS